MEFSAPIILNVAEIKGKLLRSDGTNVGGGPKNPYVWVQNGFKIAFCEIFVK